MIEIANLPIGRVDLPGPPYRTSDPILQSLIDAADDDEPLTAEDELALDEADDEIAHGQTVRDEDLGAV